MTDPILFVGLLLASGAALALGSLTLLTRRAHDRRLRERIRDSIRLYAVIRASFAERRWT